MYDVIVIGAGVSGIACCANINSNLKTLLIDKNSQIGKKLSLTGGGRCNITNINYGQDFLSNIYNYKFMYSSFAKFDNYSLLELMNNLGVELKEEDHGRMFPTTNKSSTIIEKLSTTLKHVEINLNEEVLNISYEKNMYIIETDISKYQCKKLVIAAGGISYPSTGSDGFGFKIAKQFGHKITKLIASEAPIYSNNKICTALQGITIDNAAIKYDKNSYTGYNLLFTHFGLSGPLALRQCFNIISNNLQLINIDFMPNYKEEEILKMLDSNDYISTILKPYFTKSVLKYILEETNTTSKSYRSISKNDRTKLLEYIKNYPIEITKYADVSKGFVTAGGIELKEINNKTFESKLNPNLYFIGEVLDVHSHTGGYNITTYFSMGYNCGINL